MLKSTETVKEDLVIIIINEFVVKILREVQIQ